MQECKSRSDLTTKVGQADWYSRGTLTPQAGRGGVGGVLGGVLGDNPASGLQMDALLLHCRERAGARIMCPHIYMLKKMRSLE
jgi:hypothetical protein